jgi:ABC-2 type transport system permease protein
VILMFLLMGGLFTPVDSMPDWAQAAAQANPIKHFVFIMRAVLVRAQDWKRWEHRSSGLGVAGVAVLTLAVRRYRKSTA